ncbi:MAG: amidohydrolase [Acidobacteriaceae bacterium]|nr:amidohydrolase [Acidobacteriaceae bacterium]
MQKRWPIVLACTAVLSFAPLLPSQDGMTLLLVNGKFWTVNPQQQEVEAVAIRGNRIAAVGTNADIMRLKSPETAVLDLEGKRVLPGFDDSHVHFFDGGSALAGPQLRYAKSQEEFRNTIGEYAKHRPSGTWITQGEWDEENWSPAALPTRQLIDPVTKDWPVFVDRLDGHEALANSLAMKLADVDKNTKDVPGGVIVRDADGNPTGVFKDAARGLIERVIPEATQEQIIDAIRAAQIYANAQGVTSVQDMSAAPEIFRAYQKMMHEGQLRVRISGHQPLQQWRRVANVGITADFGNEYLHIGGLKGFADGSLGSTTALMFAPYLDAPNTSGIASAELANPEQMWHNMENADAAGLQIATHAIGDKANDTILGFYERLEQEHGPRDRRLRIEHAQHLKAADLPRFGRDHVIASMQPYHCIDDGRWAEKRIGAERAKTTYAFRSLLDSGATLAFGSDWPVAPMSPIMGIYGAVTRRTLDGKHPDGWVPEQKLTVAEAVRAYTMGAAYASFEEKIKGSTEAGKLADFVVLSDDIFAVDPAKIADVKVLMTVFDGRFVIPVPPEESFYKKLPSGLILRP